MGAVALLGCAGIVLMASATAPVSASEADDYTVLMHRVLALTQFAERGDQPSLRQAIALLEAQPENSQPEVLRDLQQTPPNLTDADQRLSALVQALEARTDTPDPGRASQELNRILASTRYAPIHSGPSTLDEILGWLLRQIGGFLSALGIRSSGLPPAEFFIVLGAVVLAAILLWAFITSPRGGPREPSPRRGKPVPRRPVDFFAEADRLAAAADYFGAVRALAGGVADRLSGERAWSSSSLTVRELFARAERPDRLRPLLLSFEAAIYGHRPLDASAYQRALEAAAPFRGARE